MVAVTSFSARGYDIYGRRCLESFVANWPCELVVWYEAMPDFRHEKIIYKPIADIDSLTAFMDVVGAMPETDGMIGGSYNYSFDARRFCKKVFVQDASFDMDDEVFWLDADTVTVNRIPSSFLGGLLARHPFAYLGRRNTYTETGFLGFNTKHREFGAFRRKYASAYTSGRIFQQRVAWHDCIAFDMARVGIAGNDLNGGTPYQGVDHCFPHTVLAEYIQHHKGPRRKRKAYGDTA